MNKNTVITMSYSDITGLASPQYVKIEKGFPINGIVASPIPPKTDIENLLTDIMNPDNFPSVRHTKNFLGSIVRNAMPLVDLTINIHNNFSQNLLALSCDVNDKEYTRENKDEKIIFYHKHSTSRITVSKICNFSIPPAVIIVVTIEDNENKLPCNCNGRLLSIIGQANLFSNITEIKYKK